MSRQTRIGYEAQGESAGYREPLMIKAKQRKSGGCTMKDCVLTRGIFRREPERAMAQDWSGKSAEVIVVGQYGGGLNESVYEYPNQC